jgi:pimeloyl-ACP methyl ester carboxylesterase
LPVWYAGWSTGAEQALAAATAKHRPKSLVGLILAATGTHGRYGITPSDLLGVDPSGPDTFAMVDMAKRLGRLCVVDFTAGLDPLDDVDWVEHVPGPHQLIEVPDVLHDMGNAGPDFQSRLDAAIAWTLHPTS